MAMSLSTMIFTMAMLLSGVAGQEPDPNKVPIFAYPPDGSNNTYNKMDTVMVTYTCFYDTAVLWTFCEPGVGRWIYQQKAPGNTATVPILLNFTSTTPCWFNVRTGEDGIDGMNSAAFNLIGEERSGGPMVFGLEADSQTSSTSTASTASSSTASSSTSSSSSSGTIGGFPSAATTNDSGNSSSSSSTPDPDLTATDDASSSGEERGSAGLSAGASAGIGIGAAIGTITVAGGAFMMWRRRRQRRGVTEQHAAAAARAEMPETGADGRSQNLPDTQKSDHGVELSAVDTPYHELPGLTPRAGFGELATGFNRSMPKSDSPAQYY